MTWAFCAFRLEALPSMSWTGISEMFMGAASTRETAARARNVASNLGVRMRRQNASTGPDVNRSDSPIDSPPLLP
jgi:hypothetical protein